MAYTLAHMAAALPFYRKNTPTHSLRWLNFEAMLIGSMMPDVPYYVGNLFINFASDEKAWVTSHDWISLLTYCLPWGLALFALWQWWLKPALFGLINPFLYPSFILQSLVIKEHPRQNIHNIQQSRECNIDFSPVNNMSISVGSRPKTTHSINIQEAQPIILRALYWLSHHFLPIAIALVFGAATHLIWDGITHPDGFIANRFDWLQIWISIPLLDNIQLARFLQFFTSVIGIAALIRFTSILFLKQRKNNLSTLHSLNKVVNNSASNPNLKQLQRFNPPHLLFSKTQSLLIIGFIAITSIIIGLRESLRFYPLFVSQPYSFAAQVLIRWLPKTAVIVFFYTLLFHIIYWFNHSRRI